MLHHDYIIRISLFYIIDNILHIIKVINVIFRLPLTVMETLDVLLAVPTVLLAIHMYLNTPPGDIVLLQTPELLLSISILFSYS